MRNVVRRCVGIGLLVAGLVGCAQAPREVTAQDARDARRFVSLATAEIVTVERLSADELRVRPEAGATSLSSAFEASRVRSASPNVPSRH